MDFDRMRYFCTIAQTGNIHRAAELLRLSPAALSKALRSLEAELNTKLTVPAGRGILITDEGKEFATRAEKILAEVAAIQGGFRSPTPRRTVLRLGSFEVFTTHFLGPAVREHFPTSELLVHELAPGKLEESLLNREIDIGITYIPIPKGELDFLKVGQISMGIFGKKKIFGERESDDLPFVVPVTPISGSPTKVQGLDGWPDDQIPRKIVHRVTLLESALALCREDCAVGYFPKFVVNLHNEKHLERYRLEELPLPKKFPAGAAHQEVYLIKRKADREDDAFKLVSKALRLGLKR